MARGERARLDVVLVRAALPRALGGRGLRLRSPGEEAWTAEPWPRGPLRPGHRARRRLAQLAARDACGPLPAGRPPAAERDGRRLGAAAARARPDTGDAGGSGRPRRAPPGGRRPAARPGLP